MLLMIDNYDSFTYNLVQYLGELGEEVLVRRNDRIGIAEIRAMRPRRIVISPGPCTPKEAGISVPVVQELAGEIPLLGVCLGHQSIGHAYGGQVVRAGELMHGKTSMVHHDGSALFAGVSNPFQATRYHSLIVARDGFPDCLKATAWVDDGTVMALEHRELPVYGVQFHPESILTTEGKRILKNFLENT